MRSSESDVEPPSATEPPPVRPVPAETVSAPELVRSELPIDVVATTWPLAFVERRALVMEVKKTEEVAVSCEVEALVKFCIAEKKLE